MPRTAVSQIWEEGDFLSRLCRFGTYGTGLLIFLKYLWWQPINTNFKQRKDFISEHKPKQTASNTSHNTASGRRNRWADRVPHTPVIPHRGTVLYQGGEKISSKKSVHVVPHL
jgi:hypothetical protein